MNLFAGIHVPPRWPRGEQSSAASLADVAPEGARTASRCLSAGTSLQGCPLNARDHTQEEGKAGAAGQLSLRLIGERRGFRANVGSLSWSPWLAGAVPSLTDGWLPGTSFGTETKREPEPRLGQRLWDGGASGEETHPESRLRFSVGTGRSWAYDLVFCCGAHPLCHLGLRAANSSFKGPRVEHVWRNC